MILVGVGFALLLTAAAKYLGPHRARHGQGLPVRVRLRAHRQPARALRGQVLPGRDPLPGVRHRSRRSCTRGRCSTASSPARRRWTRGVCSRRRLVLRPRRDAGVHRSPGRRARLRLAQERDRMGVEQSDGPRVATRRKLRRRGQLGAQVLALHVPVRHRLLRHGVHVGRRAQVRHRPLRRRGPALLAAPGRPADGRRHDHPAAGPGAPPHLRADVRAQVGHRLRRLRVDRRLLPQLHDDAGHRPDHPGRRLHPRLPAAPRAGARRPDAAAGPDPARRRAQPGRAQARAARSPPQPRRASSSMSAEGPATR